MEVTVPTSKSPDRDADATSLPAPAKPAPFTNGILRRHNPHIPVIVNYKECLKNHAASMGGHALDGCGEFLPSPLATNSDPTSLKCAACGCHRNFHRRESDDHHSPTSPPHPPTPTLLPNSSAAEFQPIHRHQPPPPQHPLNLSPNSSSPPPISSSYYPPGPRMLLAISNGHQMMLNPPSGLSMSPRKRFRTKFSSPQKDKMFRFAEKVGWKMQKRDSEMIAEFCNEVNVDRSVLKVWMHNNKKTFGKRGGFDDAVFSPPAAAEAVPENADDDDDADTDAGADPDADASPFIAAEAVANGGSHSSS